MITSTYTTTHTVYQSERFPALKSERECDRETIEWLEANPVAYDIVTQKKSHVFGAGSATYIGSSSGRDAPAILYRVAVVRAVANDEDVMGVHRRGHPFFPWRAQYVLKHYRDRGFAGGFITLFDGKYERSGTSIDYTPETQADVVEQYLAWCDPYYIRQSVRIKAGKKIMWEQAIPARSDKP